MPELSQADLLLCDMVRQNIRPDEHGNYFSGFIRAHAEALRYLCRVGMMQPARYYEDALDAIDRDFSAVMIHSVTMHIGHMTEIGEWTTELAEKIAGIKPALPHEEVTQWHLSLPKNDPVITGLLNDGRLSAEEIALREYQEATSEPRRDPEEPDV